MKNSYSSEDLEIATLFGPMVATFTSTAHVSITAHDIVVNGVKYYGHFHLYNGRSQGRDYDGWDFDLNQYGRVDRSAFYMSYSWGHKKAAQQASEAARNKVIAALPALVTKLAESNVDVMRANEINSDRIRRDGLVRDVNDARQALDAAEYALDAHDATVASKRS